LLTISLEVAIANLPSQKCWLNQLPLSKYGRIKLIKYTVPSALIICPIIMDIENTLKLNFATRT